MFFRRLVFLALFISLVMIVPETLHAGRQREQLGRGLIALRITDNRVFLSWRALATDSPELAFNLYRLNGDDAIRLNADAILGATCFIDQRFDASQKNTYYVVPVLDNRELGRSEPFELPAESPVQPYLSVPLKTPAHCTPNDASVGDLDGDGEYEVVVKQEMRGIDNSRSGFSGQTKLEAYKLDGTLLWRIDLGRNIREGAHYTPFIVFDLDGDGCAEVACKTADGTVDGTGKTIGDADVDLRDARGYVLDGPEWLTIFDGRTGAELSTTEYIPPRGNVRDWGDDYGNRVDRFLAGVAYLDGQRPSLVMCRGYYTRAVLAAWNWRDGRLTHVWTFDSDDGTPGNRNYRGQGNHSLSIGDVDDDGKDEIVYGACCIDDDGSGLYTTDMGHGDALHLSDLDPDRPGLEVFGIHERPDHPHGANLRDAATGKVIWSVKSPDVGRGVALDIDPRYPGSECWAAGGGLDALWNCRGEVIPGPKPRSCNMGVWWDGDLQRELLDGTRIDKWDYQRGASERLVSADRFDCASNNGSKANPCLCADILGDWREEVIWRTRDGRELRIFSTTIPTKYRLTTLMHDPIYRMSVAWQNVGYNQPAHPGFCLEETVAQATPARSAEADQGLVAPKPLYRDPVYDGAADPVLIWNRQREKWWMLYTNRRANVPALRGVSWVHGTRIGIAESADGGATWKYLRTAQIDLGVEEDSHWAPDVVFHDGRYHMFLSFVPGMHEDWSGTRHIHHLTSPDLIHWQNQGRLPLATERVIDACVLQLADGTWRMWYNNEPDHKAIYLAESPDLIHWTDRGKVIGDKAGEGPKVFRWQGYYWMIVDQWQGLGVYRSTDTSDWKGQPSNLLAAPGRGLDDQVKGGHADVVVSGNRAFLFYFTHPGRRGADADKDGYEQRRSSIQVVELKVVDDWLHCDRDKQVRIRLLPPKKTPK